MIKKHIPNALTCCNLLSGCMGVFQAYSGQVKMALWWIIIGAVFDFFDGMSARLLKVSSPIGKELDSLADNVTFGVAPATIILFELSVIDYPSFMQKILFSQVSLQTVTPYVAFILIVAFSALRLAKFNIDERQTTSFIGLPTPANALFWGSLIATRSEWLEISTWMVPVVLVMVAFSAWLLVSEIPMFALKFKHWGWKGNEVKYCFILFAVVAIALFGPLTAFWVIIALYFILSVILDVINHDFRSNVEQQ